jgi:membrane associated rhomboid family serine protease
MRGNKRFGSDFPFFTCLLLLLFLIIAYKTYLTGNMCLGDLCFRLGGKEGKIISRAFWYYFAHDGTDHLLGNMILFGLLFYYFEKELNGIFPLVIFLFSAIVSGILYLYLDPCSDIISVVGASGGCFGLMGSFFVYNSKGKIHFISFVENSLMIRILRIFIKVLILLMFLFQLYSLPMTECKMLAYSIHISGFIVGVILMVIYRVMKKYATLKS